MHTYVFIDLDDTLFQTLPKCPVGETATPAAFRKDGSPVSYMTERQARFFAHLRGMGTLIPTTARNHDAFRRVNLEFTSFAILDFGGVVLLPEGAVDPVWDAVVRPQAMALGEELLRALAAVEDWNSSTRAGVSARVIVDFDMPLYLVVKHPQGNTAALTQLKESDAWPRDVRFFTHHNDNNLSLVPRFLGKEEAVRHVMATHLEQPALTFGCGDSDSDAAFLALCDYAVAPRGAQLTRPWM
jgi:hypothetical protein